MKNIIITHAPVENVAWIGNLGVFTTDNGKYIIKFSKGDDCYFRSVFHAGKFGYDSVDAFCTFDDYLQWTVDNFCEIEELF